MTQDQDLKRALVEPVEHATPQIAKPIYVRSLPDAEVVDPAPSPPAVPALPAPRLAEEPSTERRAFRLAVETDLLRRAHVPVIHTPEPANARTGFCEPDEFALLFAQLPDYLQPPIAFAFYTGWRIPSEVLPLAWRQVDFRAGVV